MTGRPRKRQRGWAGCGERSRPCLVRSLHLCTAPLCAAPFSSFSRLLSVHFSDLSKAKSVLGWQGTPKKTASFPLTRKKTLLTDSAYRSQ